VAIEKNGSRRPYSVPSAKVLFGEQLKTLRLARKLSQEKLSEMCDFHHTHVGRLERAERTITFDAIQRLSYALQVLPHEFLKNQPIPKKLPPKRKKREE
jgi:transcriptional regulator with XRE-family HTH domain